MKNKTDGWVWDDLRNFGGLIAWLLLAVLLLAAMRFFNTFDLSSLLVIGGVLGLGTVLWAFTSLLAKFF